jgi:probable phosphoglycerate mutase
VSGPLPTPPAHVRTRGPRPTGAQIVIVRHGEAVCNLEGTIGGPIGDGGLTELGVRQAEALRDRLARSGELAGAVALYTSTLPRAIETGEIIAPALAAGIEARVDDELSELRPGEADGMGWDEFVERFGAPDWDSDPSAPIAPGGESWTGFYERCERALAALAGTHRGEQVVVVAHGGVVEQALKLVFDEEPGARLRLRTENCSMTELEHRDGRWHLLRYNDRAPLDTETAAVFTSYVELAEE